MLHLHIICLNYDGNAFDLCLLAAVAALEELGAGEKGAFQLKVYLKAHGT